MTKVWGTLCDGEFEIINLEDADIEEALDILESFFANENVCIATEINLPQQGQSRKELRELCRIINEDHVSLVVRQVDTKKLAAVAFNKIQYNDDSGEVPFFIEFRDKHCKTPNAICLMDYMIDMDQGIDPFKQFNINCLLELTFLGTLPEFRRRGLGNALCKYTIELARALKQGVGIDRLPKSLQNKRPKAVTALFTSNYSKQIGKHNNFQVLNRVPYDKFSFNGKLFSERIGPVHVDCEQVAFLI